MKKLLLLLGAPLFLVAFSWDYSHDFVLKKDETARIIVSERRDITRKRELSFRWTLFQNKRLVLLVKYGGNPMQFVLQQVYKRNSIKINLRDDYHDGFNRSYVMLTFKRFDEGNQTALLKTSISDPKKRIEIRFEDFKK